MASQYKLTLTVAVLLAAVVVQAQSATTVYRRLPYIPFPTTKYTTVSMTNNLEGQESLEVHCKDAHSDFGVQEVAYGAEYDIQFTAGEGADYYCRFVFNGGVHWFDIYRGGRDEDCAARSKHCSRVIKENGPCFHDGSLPEDQCYPWNQNYNNY